RRRSVAPWTARRNLRSIAAAWPAERPAMDGRAGWIRKMDVAPWMAQRSSTKAAPSRDRPKPGHGIDWRDGAERLGVSPRKAPKATRRPETSRPTRLIRSPPPESPPTPPPVPHSHRSPEATVMKHLAALALALV